MRTFYLLAALPVVAVAACQDPVPEVSPAPPAEPAAVIAGHCVYMNPFSQREECKELHGAGWTRQAALDECKAQSADLKEGACTYPETLGACVLKGEPERLVHLVFPGNDAASCSLMELGCEVFAGGAFEEAGICVGQTDPTPPDPVAGTVFQPPELICRDPLPGEPLGESRGGQVCTWEMISGATEEGRHFDDYASCDRVYTQRPYYPAPSNGVDTKDDDRLNNPAYVAELQWVTEQVEATACVCCHKASITPDGPAMWDIEAPGNWVNTFSDYGLAFAGGVLDSSLLGAYPASENNGFDRATTGIPTTDPARMRAFFQAELDHRGVAKDAFADATPVPDFFYDQFIYEPSKCEGGEGVAADGTITWSGGRARYVYVLEAGSNNPGVPPNLDLPSGTRWRVDVPPSAQGIESGSLRYGEVPKGMTQAFPKEGAPAALDPAKTYYLYALADVAVPITRCLFTPAIP